MIAVRLEGTRMHDIASFYEEINRVLMVGVDWQLGPSLDALDDLLHGGYGTLHGHDAARIVWADHAHAATALGLAATRAQLLEKLEAPERFDTDLIRRRLEQLEAEGGPTYFDTIVEILGSHPRLEIVLD